MTSSTAGRSSCSKNLHLQLNTELGQVHDQPPDLFEVVHQLTFICARCLHRPVHLSLHSFVLTVQFSQPFRAEPIEKFMESMELCAHLPGQVRKFFSHRAI